MKTIDLNADLGEHPGSNLDAEIMPYLSSCNIACGGHVGDEASVRETILLARKHQVTIGAHPSFPDSINFGRVEMKVAPDSLRGALSDQINLVKSIAEELNINLNHIKPHGALYTLAAKDEVTSNMIGEVISAIDPSLKWMGLAYSVTEKVAAQLNIEFIAEAFVDRRYLPDKTLKSRACADAVIKEEEQVLKQLEELVFRGRVYSSEWISIEAKSICLHGDTPGAINLAKKIHNHLVFRGVHIHSV